MEIPGKSDRWSFDNWRINVNAWFLSLAARHRQTGLLIDTNILMLWAVGRLSMDVLTTFKRTKQFSTFDLYLLNAILPLFSRILTTPSVVTEVSNLCGQLPGDIRRRFFTRWSQDIGALVEIYTPSEHLVSREGFIDFGVTDAAIEDAAHKGVLVLTDDFRLSGYLDSVGLNAVNFNHLRGPL